MLKFIFVSIIIAFFIKICLLFYNFLIIKSKISLIPGPNSTHWLGDLSLFYNQSSSLSENFFTTLQALSKVYSNEGIFKLRFGNKFIVCVYKACHLKKIMGSNINISKSVEYKLLNDWLGDGLLLADNTSWFKQRNLLSKAFRNEVTKSLLPIIEEKVDVFIENINNSSETYMNTNKTFEFTLDVICETLFRHKLVSEENKAYLSCIHDLTKSFTKRTLNPLLWVDCLFKITNTGKEYMTNLQQLRTLSRKIVLKKCEEFAETKQVDNKSSSLIEIIANKYPDLNAETIDKTCREMNTFLFAGHDTTALTINWIIYSLGLYPEEQAKLREEIKSVISPSGVIDVDRVDKLVQLDCFIKECLRLFPPVPLIGRHVSKELNIGDYIVPKDTMLYVLIDQLHEDPSVYEKPKMFRPSRFEQNNIPPISYIPFSAGPRNCIGKKLALIVIKIFITKLVFNYTIKSEDTVDHIQTSYDIVLKPKYPLKIKLIKNL